MSVVRRLATPAALLATLALAAVPLVSMSQQEHGQADPPHAELMHEHMQQMMDRHLDHLAARLEIRASQQEAWKGFAGAVRGMVPAAPPESPGKDLDAATRARQAADRAADRAKRLAQLADATAKLQQLQAVGADVVVVAPHVHEDIVRSGVPVVRRPFEPGDLDGAWFVVAAATPEVNRAVASAADERHVFVNAVDDPPNASAFLSGVVRRADVTVAISTSGDAPALSGLLREALEAVLPEDLDKWMAVAREERAKWRRDGVPMNERRPLLLEALNRIYGLASKPELAKQPDQELISASSAKSAARFRKDS